MKPAPSLRVGLNLLFLGASAGGIGRYAEALARHLADEPDVELTAFVSRDAPEQLFVHPWSDRVQWASLPVGLGSLPSTVAAQVALLPLAVRQRAIDVLHSPSGIGPWRLARCANVVTLHDLVWIHHPEQWESRRAARSARVLATMTARGADLVITGSNAAQRDLVETLGLSPDSVTVIPHGVDRPRVTPMAEFEVRDRIGLNDRPLILCVAQKRPYKNQEALIRSLPHLPEAGLVLPGTPTDYEAHLRRLARELSVTEQVCMLPWVSEAELEGLYAVARCFALPTRFEGFGLPVLEAMARGVPVVCSNVWSLPEVAGDAALLVEPDDGAALTSALRRVLYDDELARRLSLDGLARARTFTWTRTARESIGAYRRATARR